MSDPLGVDDSPASNLNAEQSVLGAMLCDPNVIDDISEKLKADQFYGWNNAEIFKAVCSLHSDGKYLDALTVSEELERRGVLTDVGGPAYVLEVMESVPHAAHATAYAKIVVERWVRRSVNRVATEAIRDAADMSKEPSEVAGRAEAKMLELAGCHHKPSTMHISEIMAEVMHSIESGVTPGIRTGFYDLDAITFGMQAGNLIILAARPSVGKTSFAANLLLNVAQLQDEPVLIVSLEQSKTELVERMLCSLAEYPSHQIKGGSVSAADKEMLMDQSARLNAMPIYIEDDSGATVSRISSISRSMKRKHGLSVIVIDYLQLISPEDRRSPREQQVSEMSRGLKLLARQLEVPVVCLAQLNREIEKRAIKKPVLSDLRESGAIEQDADLVWFLDRPSLYDARGEDGSPIPDTEAWLHVSKHRNGRVGSVKLHWDDKTMTYRNASTFDHITF